MKYGNNTFVQGNKMPKVYSIVGASPTLLKM
jgi:hypothetical protein